MATVCKDYGQRVQLSVFECRVSDSQYETLRDRLVKTIEPTLDSIRVYRLPAPNCIRLSGWMRIGTFEMKDKNPSQLIASGFRAG